MPDTDGALMDPNAQPQMRAPNLTKTLQLEISGVLGIGSSKADAAIWLEKSRFAPGEEVRVHIDMNNKGCKKPLKWFKTYLKRVVTFYSGKANETTLAIEDEEEEIFHKKHDPNVGANEQKETIIKFKLPLRDHNFGSTKGMHTDLQHMVSMMSLSCENSLFRVHYVLDVYVKHQSKLEWGRGNLVSFPITIRS